MTLNQTIDARLVRACQTWRPHGRLAEALELANGWSCQDGVGIEATVFAYESDPGRTSRPPVTWLSPKTKELRTAPRTPRRSVLGARGP